MGKMFKNIAVLNRLMLILLCFWATHINASGIPVHPAIVNSALEQNKQPIQADQIIVSEPQNDTMVQSFSIEHVGLWLIANVMLVSFIVFSLSTLAYQFTRTSWHRNLFFRINSFVNRFNISAKIARYKTVGVAVINKKGHFVSANKRFCEITGYSLIELKHKHITQLSKPEFLHNQQFRSFYPEEQTTNSNLKKTDSIIDVRGDKIEVNLTISKTRNNLISKIYFLSLVKKSVSSDRHSSVRRLNQLSSSQIPRLSGLPAHTVKSKHVANSGQLLSQYKNMNPEENPMKISKEDFIKEMLLLSPEIPISINPSTIDDIVTNSIAKSEKAKNVNIGKDLNLRGIEILMDCDQLSTALEAIFENAFEACDKSGIPPQMNVSTKHQDDRFEITVSDNGEGIALEILPNIFNPFYSTRNNKVGNGLTRARHIMEAYKGGIDVETTPGSGSQITLWIPDDSRLDNVREAA